MFIIKDWAISISTIRGKSYPYLLRRAVEAHYNIPGKHKICLFTREYLPVNHLMWLLTHPSRANLRIQKLHLSSPSPLPTVTAPALGNCCMAIIGKTGTKREVFFRAGLLLLAFLNILFLLWVFACVYVCAPCVCAPCVRMVPIRPEEVSDPWELESHTVMRSHVEARNWTWVLCKNSQWVHLSAQPLSSPQNKDS